MIFFSQDEEPPVSDAGVADNNPLPFLSIVMVLSSTLIFSSLRDFCLLQLHLLKYFCLSCKYFCGPHSRGDAITNVRPMMFAFGDIFVPSPIAVSKKSKPIIA